MADATQITKNEVNSVLKLNLSSSITWVTTPHIIIDIIPARIIDFPAFGKVTSIM
jgi:hypothetical protein